MPLLIPVWFYGFDSIMYLISSIVGLLLSFYFHKIYSLSSDKKHMYLYFGFLLLSFGLLSLSITNIFSYITFWHCQRFCVLGIIDQAFGLEDFSYFLYFGLSILAYALFMLAYTPKNFKLPNLPFSISLIYFIIILITLPLTKGDIAWYTYHSFFHLIAFLMLAFVSFMNIINFSEKENLNSFLVAAAFTLLALFHLLHMFSFISGWMYVSAHLSMLIGSILLLSVVVRVKSK